MSVQTTLFGRPVVFTDELPPPGPPGDLVLLPPSIDLAVSRAEYDAICEALSRLSRGLVGREEYIEFVRGVLGEGRCLAAARATLNGQYVNLKVGRPE